MTTVQIRHKLHQYIDVAQDKKLKAIYSLIQEEVDEINGYWKDVDFIEDLKKVEALHIAGKTKSYSIEEAVSLSKQKLEKVKK